MDSTNIQPLTLHQPKTLVFGCGVSGAFVDDAAAIKLKRIFVVTSEPIRGLVDPVCAALEKNGIETVVFDQVLGEPSITLFETVLEKAAEFGPDGVAGIGGGSVLDVAKLVAALYDTKQPVREVFGIGQVAGRSTWLALLPTTSGTGSEISPNAILSDEEAGLKKGIVSPCLVADAAYVDPALTVSVPPQLTASTGMDALTHCIEAYANKFAHPIIDVYALKGIELISRNLRRAVEKGKDLEAREKLALGSMFGGYCLGQVNTGAVHALAYPLGGEFHVPHGVSNSMLLPHVLKFNLPAAPERYAQIALAMGVEPGGSDEETALRGLGFLRELSADCGIPQSLSEVGVPEDAIPGMAKSAMQVTRLLQKNVREVTENDAAEIYREAF